MGIAPSAFSLPSLKSEFMRFLNTREDKLPYFCTWFGMLFLFGLLSLHVIVFCPDGVVLQFLGPILFNS